MTTPTDQALAEYKRGKTVGEIALLTGLSVNQVRAAIRKARS